MALAVDASSPASVIPVGDTTTTIVTASFTPPSGSVLVAMAGLIYSGSGVAGPPFGVTDSVGGSWAEYKIQCTNATLAGVWISYVATGAPMTVTLTTDALQKGKMLTVKVITGTSNSGYIGVPKTFQSATVVGLAQSFTPSNTGSLVMLASSYDTTGTINENAATTEYIQNVDATDGARIQSGQSAVTTTANTPVTLGWTGDTAAIQKAWVGIEILNAGAIYTAPISTAILRPTTVAGTTGTTWTNTTNATGAPNATFATWTNVASGGTGAIRLSGFGAQAAMGGVAPTSITSIDVTVAAYVTNVTRVTSQSVQLYQSGSPIGSATALTLSTTTTNTQTVTLTGANLPTWAQLANLEVNVGFGRAAVTTAGNGLVDAVGIAVNYVPVPGTGGVLAPPVILQTALQRSVTY